MRYIGSLSSYGWCIVVGLSPSGFTARETKVHMVCESKLTTGEAGWAILGPFWQSLPNSYLTTLSKKWPQLKKKCSIWVYKSSYFLILSKLRYMTFCKKYDFLTSSLLISPCACFSIMVKVCVKSTLFMDPQLLSSVLALAQLRPIDQSCQCIRKTWKCLILLNSTYLSYSWK